MYRERLVLQSLVICIFSNIFCQKLKKILDIFFLLIFKVKYQSSEILLIVCGVLLLRWYHTYNIYTQGIPELRGEKSIEGLVEKNKLIGPNLP